MTLTPPPPIGSGSLAISVAGFPAIIGPFPSVQPFSYQEGLTFQKLFESYRHWILNELVPHVDHNAESIAAAYNTASAALAQAMIDYAEEIAADREVFNRLVKDTLDEMNAAIAANAQAMAAALATGKTQIDQGVTDARAARDAAVVARNQAEQFAANTVALQDATVTALFNNASSSTYLKLVGIIPVEVKKMTADKFNDSVKTSLGKADTAYQLPNTGVPDNQLASKFVKTVAQVSPDNTGDVPLASIPRPQEVSNAVGLSNLFVLGDSIARGSGANRTAGGFGGRLAAGSHLDPVSYVNDAVSGTVANDIMTNILGANGYSNAANRPGLAVVHTGINSLINIGPDDAANEVKSFTLAMKNVLRALRGTWTAFDDASIVYTGTWADAILAIGRVSNKKKTSTNGSYFTITSNASEIAVMGVGFSTRSGNGASFSVTVNGAAYVPEITTFAGTASTNNAQTYGSVGFRVVNPTPGSAMSVRVTRTGGVGDMFCDGYIAKTGAPPMVAMCKIIMPTQAGLNINGAAANRVPAVVDQYNQIIDDISKSVEFLEGGKVVALDISTDFVNATMRPGDGIHPNDLGHRKIEENIERWARTALATPTRGIHYI